LTVIAILVLALVLTVVWRLARLAVKLILLGALIILIAGYATSATTHHAAGAPTRSAPPGAQQRPPGAPGSDRPKRRSRAPVKRPAKGRR
jgi:hypothetical protein